MFDLGGKTAIITGASGGIGRVVAVALANAGAAVVLAGTRAQALEETAAAVPEGKAALVTGNITDSSTHAALLEAAESFGGAAILINNAGITRDTLAMRMKDDDWAHVLQVNLTACAQLAQACLKPMMKARWGRIINITSVVGTTGNPGQTNYAAAKAGLAGYSKSLAQEVASRGVTVNCIAPGFIRTAMTDKLNDQQQQAITQRIPMGSMGTPEDIAAAALYLASPAAGYVTGQTVHVNGGMVMP